MRRYFLLIALSLGLATAIQAQITAPVETPASTANPEAKYLVPIPKEETGQVYLERVLTLPEGTHTEDTFAKLKDWLDRCMQDPRIASSTPVEVDAPYTLQQMINNQEVIFSKGLLALDNAFMSYLLQLELKDGKIILKMRRISYRYNGDNPNRKMLRLAAEDYISDEIALNKKGTKMTHSYRKFRTKTVDLIDEYEASLKMAFWIK